MRYGFNPAAVTVLRNVFSCIRGEQAAMTTRFRRFFLMASRMAACPGSLQLYLLSSTWVTIGIFLTASVTLGISTVPAILVPQWQMKTPILAIVSLLYFLVGFRCH